MTHKTVTIGGRNIELLSALGQGTYGSVYLINVDGAMKAIKIITNVGKEGIKSLRELDIMGRLVHPNLVRTEGIIVGIEENKPAALSSPLPFGIPVPPPLVIPEPPDSTVTVGIIMPLATTDLQRLLKNTSFNTNQRLKILFDILSGVKYLHDTNHLHMDLKPMNVLIFGEGNNLMARLTDFGISLIMDDTMTKYYPLELVTVTHRAPEIISGDRVYTRASDIWSLGIIFLEVLSGGKTIFPDFTKTKVRTTIKKLFSHSNIDQTLNSYLSGHPNHIKDPAIKLIKSMLNTNSARRPTVDQIMASPLFHGIKKDIGHGMAIYKRPYPPRKCDVIYYYGYDFMVRLATKLAIKLETFFLAADIFQRALAYGHHLTGDFKKDWANVALTAATSLYMAIKMIEPYSPDPVAITKLSSNVFTSGDIIKVEASLTQLFEGMLYPRNLFTDSAGKNRLVYAFDKLLRNCHLYYRIDLDRWVQDETNKQEMPYNKNILLSQFIGNTEYYKLIQTQKRNQYIPDMYNNDVTAAAAKKLQK